MPIRAFMYHTNSQNLCMLCTNSLPKLCTSCTNFCFTGIYIYSYSSLTQIFASHAQIFVIACTCWKNGSNNFFHSVIFWRERECFWEKFGWLVCDDLCSLCTLLCMQYQTVWIKRNSPLFVTLALFINLIRYQNLYCPKIVKMFFGYKLFCMLEQKFNMWYWIYIINVQIAFVIILAMILLSQIECIPSMQTRLFVTKSIPGITNSHPHGDSYKPCQWLCQYDQRSKCNFSYLSYLAYLAMV